MCDEKPTGLSLSLSLPSQLLLSGKLNSLRQQQHGQLLYSVLFAAAGSAVDLDNGALSGGCPPYFKVKGHFGFLDAQTGKNLPYLSRCNAFAHAVHIGYCDTFEKRERHV